MHPAPTSSGPTRAAIGHEMPLPLDLKRKDMVGQMMQL